MPVPVSGPDAPSPLYSYPATVLDIHDGDTIRWRLDKGHGAEMTMWLRMAGYDAAEIKDADRGTKARDLVTKLLADVTTRTDFKGWVVQSIRTTGGADVMTFARYLGYVFGSFVDKSAPGGLRFEPMNPAIYNALKTAGLLKRGSKWNPPAETDPPG